MQKDLFVRPFRIALLVCLLASAVGIALSSEGKLDKSLPGSEALTGAVNQFGLDVLGAAMVPDKNTGGASNILISPLSVHAVLSMVANGATGQTAQQMRQVLHTETFTHNDTHRQWTTLLGALAKSVDGQTLKIANALWARPELHLNPVFLTENRETFRAHLETLDFTQAKATGIINNWVSQNTQGMIPKMLDELPKDTQLILANAVYFKADWTVPFDHESTTQTAFARADGSKTDVAMMHSAGRLPFAQNTRVKATRLSYKGQATAYYIFLPKPGVSLETARASLSGSGLAELMKSMDAHDPVQVILGLPKLDTSFGADLASQLARLGMPDAFNTTRANFSAMAESTTPIVLGPVLHKTRLKVDEQGSEAAAATLAGMMTGTAMPRNPPEVMLCDHPYLFAVADQKTGVILLLGAVNDPSLH